MEPNGGNQYLHTAPWQKVLISVAGLFALVSILALLYTWFQGNGEGNFWDRFMVEEQEEIIYTEEEKLDILRSLRTEEDLKPMTPEEETREVERKEEVLQAVSSSGEGEETPPDEEKLNILDALRNAE